MNLSSGGPADRPAPGIPQAVASFGRPVAVLIRPDLPGERLAQEAFTNGVPTSIDIAYGAGEATIVVRTIRRSPGEPEVQPVPSLAGALASFAANAQATAPGRLGPETVLRYLSEASSVSPEDHEVSLAGAVTPARLLRIAAYEALDARHEEETVVCLGPAGTLRDVVLDVLTPRPDGGRPPTGAT
jgi:hypothetical protein